MPFLGVCIVCPFMGLLPALSGGGGGHLRDICSALSGCVAIDCITSLLQSWLSPMSCVVASEEAEPCPLLLKCMSPRAGQPVYRLPFLTALGVGLLKAPELAVALLSGGLSLLISAPSPSCSLRLARTLGSSWSWVLALMPILYFALSSWPTLVA